MKEFAFRLPDDNAEIALEVVEAVPDNWSWCSGQLDAPLSEVADGLVAEAGYVIDRMTHFGQLKIETLLDRQARENPGDGALLMERRERVTKLLSGLFLPGYVRFHEAAFDSGSYGLLALSGVKTIVRGYISRGYVGDIQFYSDCYDDTAHQNPAKVSIYLAKWREWFPRAEAERKLEYLNGEPVFDTPRVNHPPLVKMSYDEKFGGSQELISSLIAVCEKSKLEPMDASDIGPGSSYSGQL